MAVKGLGISVSDSGIGMTLNQHLLMVPPNQRSYAWEDSHVLTLFEDFSAAIANGSESYFLGTLVLTQGVGDRLEVADGQQRLATASILIAAIRDYLEQPGSNDPQAANKYTNDYLLIYDEMTGEHTPKLQLNYEDNNYFLNQVLIPEAQGKRVSTPPTTPSHRRLFEAAAQARSHVAKVVSPLAAKDRAKHLFQWIRFIRDSATVITIRVPDHINAYTMFETLNDRGLRASQTDILKNFLFGKAQDRLQETQMNWSSMVGTIETVGDEDLLLTYLRHYWTLDHGYTPERELAGLVKEEITGKQRAVTLIQGLDELAADYVGLLTPLEYAGWPSIDQHTRAYIHIISTILAIEQIRPLLLAVVKRFETRHVKPAMKMFLDWSVRFLVAGSGGGGPLDRAYGQLAKDVMMGNVKNPGQLKTQVKAVVLRTDAEFQQAFSKARVSKTNLARYYLRAMELHAAGEAHPELGGTLDDSYVFNVEHIMPQSAAAGWQIPEQTAQQYRKRLGNLVLLNPHANVKLGTKPFSEKKVVFGQSPMLLTQAVGQYTAWGPHEIDQRQEALAASATKVWPA